ncbi:MAG: electron transfer flavoprotein subunit beta/FixA family protein [Desulfovibrionaceae bacterium]|nr:electron transfer flavoprotein subunit beta/FixA family protein [Desulfovibrionaceae bacterium]
MKKIAVCYKWVLSDADIRVNEKTSELDLSRCKPQVNEYDLNGLQAGVKLKEEAGATELVGLTCGAAVEASVRDALSRGPDAVYYLEDPVMAQADSSTTSKVLAGMIKAVGDVDVVICSEGSSDEYAQQTGPRLAALLGYASVSCVSGISVQNGALELERKMEEGFEVVRAMPPLVITVTPDVGDAPIPSVKQILGAKKKPANALRLADMNLSAETISPLLKTVSILAPKTSRKALCLNSEGVSMEQAVTALVKHLNADGLL